MSRILPVQPIAFFLEFCNADYLDSQQFLGHEKIGESLLMLWVDLHQDNVFGIVIRHDRFSKKRQVRRGVETAQQVTQILIEFVISMKLRASTGW